MLQINAIIRREKVADVIAALEEEKYYAFSKWEISGRGKQKGIMIGDFMYEEMPKEMIYMVVDNDDEKNQVIDIIMQNALSGESGNAGDGKIFVTPVLESYTISSQEKDN